jgi:putative zinc finger protein
MNCDQTIEFLPWLLNGTLEEEERREALNHLKDCEACRDALDDTRLAWRIFDQHIPAGDLVAYAAGDAPEGIDGEVFTTHLAACPQCAAELELARLSRGLVEDESVALLAGPQRATASRPAPARWRAAALAAGLTGLVALGGWYKSAERARDLAGRLADTEATAAPAPAPSAGTQPGSAVDAAKIAALQRQLEEMEAKVNELQQAEGKARDQLAQIGDRGPAGPQVNTWVGDLRPNADVLRGGEATPTEVPANATATLLLNAAEEVPGEREVEIVDAQDRVVWQGHGLRLNAENRDYSLTLPRGTLPAGAYTIRLYRIADGERAPAESYSLVVR